MRDLPGDGYVGVASDFADLYAYYTEAPRPLLYFGFLTALGHLVAHKVTLASEVYPSPRLYTVLLGQSGETRKSSSIGHVVRLFTLCYPDFPEHIVHGTGSGEGLAQRLTERNGKISPLLLVIDELQLLVAKALAEGSILVPVLNSLFESTDFDNMTRERSIRIRNAYPSILTACTTDTYSDLWTSAFIRIGFVNRLWLVTGRPERSFALPGEIPKTDKDKLVNRIRETLQDVRAKPDSHTVMRLDEKARAGWESWYAGRLASVHATRLDTYGWRLMMLLSLSQGETETVRADTVRRVCILLDHQLALREEYDPIDATGKVARIEEAIRRAVRRNPGLMDRALKKSVHYERDGIWVYDQAIRNLQNSSELLYSKTKGYRLREE